MKGIADKIPLEKREKAHACVRAHVNSHPPKESNFGKSSASSWWARYETDSSLTVEQVVMMNNPNAAGPNLTFLPLSELTFLDHRPPEEMQETERKLAMMPVVTSSTCFMASQPPIVAGNMVIDGTSRTLGCLYAATLCVLEADSRNQVSDVEPVEPKSSSRKKRINPKKGDMSIEDAFDVALKFNIYVTPVMQGATKSFYDKLAARANVASGNNRKSSLGDMMLKYLEYSRESVNLDILDYFPDLKPYFGHSAASKATDRIIRGLFPNFKSMDPNVLAERKSLITKSFGFKSKKASTTASPGQFQLMTAFADCEYLLIKGCQHIIDGGKCSSGKPGFSDDVIEDFKAKNDVLLEISNIVKDDVEWDRICSEVVGGTVKPVEALAQAQSFANKLEGPPKKNPKTGETSGVSGDIPHIIKRAIVDTDPILTVSKTASVDLTVEDVKALQERIHAGATVRLVRGRSGRNQGQESTFLIFNLGTTNFDAEDD